MKIGDKFKYKGEEVTIYNFLKTEHFKIFTGLDIYIPQGKTKNGKEYSGEHQKLVNGEFTELTNECIKR